MNDQTDIFIFETPQSQVAGDWKERLLKPETGSVLRLDLMYVGGQCVADIVSGHVSENALDSNIIEAYRLQYPNLSHDISFVGEVRKLASDPDRLRGFFGGVKGKLFEIEYRDYLNAGHLPAGYSAELSEKANQPGVDILIKDSHDHIHEQLQAKAFETLQGVKEHLERYPEITPVIIPGDQIEMANADGLGHLVEGAPVTEHALDQTVNHAIGQSVSQAGIHLPWIGFSLLAGEVAYLMYKGKPVSFNQIVRRGTKMTVAGFMGQIAYLLSHSFWVGVPATLTTRIFIKRYSISKVFVELLEGKRKWAQNNSGNFSDH